MKHEHNWMRRARRFRRNVASKWIVGWRQSRLRHRSIIRTSGPATLRTTARFRLCLYFDSSLISHFTKRFLRSRKSIPRSIGSRLQLNPAIKDPDNDEMFSTRHYASTPFCDQNLYRHNLILLVIIVSMWRSNKILNAFSTLSLVFFCSFVFLFYFS